MEDTRLSVPLDRRSRLLLDAFAEACGLHPEVCAAQLLKDLLADDALYNAAMTEAASQARH